VLVLDGNSFAGDQLVGTLGVTTTGEKRILGLVQTASADSRLISLCWSCLTARRVCGRRCETSSVTGSKCSGVNGTIGRIGRIG